MTESPITSWLASLIWIAFCAVILTAPTWGPWIDQLGGPECGPVKVRV